MRREPPMRHTTLISALLIFIGATAMAESGKYKRPNATSPSTSSNQNTPSPSPSPSGSQDKKVDLTDLENRYWTAKDTEFNVVQNRVYTKAKRFSATLILGTDLSGQYTNDFNYGLQVNYYFSEREGVGIQGWKTSATTASFVNQFQQVTNNTASYNFNSPQGYIGANYNWVPIYAKLSLLEKKILYFDMSVNPGIGVTLLQSNSFQTTINNPVTVNQAPITFALDIAQQVFLTSHWAIKLDIDNHFYNETTYWAASGTGSSVAGTPQSSKLTYSAVFMLGLTFFQ